MHLVVHHAIDVRGEHVVADPQRHLELQVLRRRPAVCAWIAISSALMFGVQRGDSMKVVPTCSSHTARCRWYAGTQMACGSSRQSLLPRGFLEVERVVLRAHRHALRTRLAQRIGDVRNERRMPPWCSATGTSLTQTLAS